MPSCAPAVPRVGSALPLPREVALTTVVSETHRASPVAAAGSVLPLWACALPVALLGSWTCFAALPGINWTLWTLAATTGLLIARRAGAAAPLGVTAVTALALACALSAAAAITADPHMDALVFLSVAGSCGFALRAILMPAQPIGPAALIRLPLTLTRAVFGEAAARLAQTLALVRMQSGVPLLRGAALAGGLGAVLLLLLSAADPVLAGWRDGVWSFLHTLRFLTRGVFFVVLASALLGAYGIAARSHPADHRAAASLGPAPAVRDTLSDIERLMVLGAALGAFGLFFVVDLSAQFGLISAGRLPAGETFAQATHRGFIEMIMAAGLCAATLILLDRHALRGSRERQVLWTGAAVILASLLLVLSAYSRVRYYEAAYGYTQLRVDVQVWCAAVFVALVLLAWHLRAAAASGARLGLARLTHHVALTGIACIAFLSCWNSSAWIVNANIARYRTTGRLDVGYLADLAVTSPDAIAALVGHLPDLPRADARWLRAALARSPLAGGAAGGAPLAWYEWNLRRDAALAALRAAQAGGSTSR